VDADLPRLRPQSSLEEVAGVLATYNLVSSPVVDQFGHLVGVVTVDDVLDHMLPAGWRDRDYRKEASHGA
jgi:Mg/Co/Ni transporter MgtE